MGTGSTDSGSARRPRAGAAAAWAARTRLRRRASDEAWCSPAVQRLLLRWLEAAVAAGIRWPVVLGLSCGVGVRLLFGWLAAGDEWRVVLARRAVAAARPA